MPRSIAEKMMLKEGQRAWLLNPPDDLLDVIEAPRLEEVSELQAEFAYIHMFARSQDELSAIFPELKRHLAKGGALWISWPKGGGLGTDLSLHHVVRIGYGVGLVESTCLSIDSTWSALRFTHPKPGKTYRNSHAELVVD